MENPRCLRCNKPIEITNNGLSYLAECPTRGCTSSWPCDSKERAAEFIRGYQAALEAMGSTEEVTDV